MSAAASGVEAILSEVPLPRVAMARVQADHPHIEDVGRATIDALERGGLGGLLSAGARVAIAVGSRGIASLSAVVAATVAAARAAGGAPIVFPAMGSHGGATAEGQRHVLEALGVTEETVGAPVVSDMAVERLATVRVADREVPVCCARTALEADATVLVARVKPHTSFRAPYESGLMKMAAIGLGKQAGAEACHARGLGQLADAVQAVGSEVLTRANVVAGLAILENADHQLAELELVPTSAIAEREPQLLARAWELYPSLPVEELDVLVLDEIGKDVSGTGFDTNVVGRYPDQSVMPAAAGRSVSRLVALGLTAATGGNANGMGMVDVTSRRLYERMSFVETYPNALTSTNTTMARVPMVMDSDRLALQAAVHTSHAAGPLRMARIRNTLQPATLEVSEALVDELTGRAGIEIGALQPPAFDSAGNLAPLSPAALRG